MGISLGSSFTRTAAIPLDDSFTVIDDTARDAIDSGIRYQGMLVYVTSTETMWQLQGGITNSDWAEAGGGGVGPPTVYGDYITLPVGILAADGIDEATGAMSTTIIEVIAFIIASAGGEQNITANPQVEAHTVVGAKLRLVGTSDTDYIVLKDGNGLSLNGPWSAFNRSSIDLWWNGNVWTELSRRA
jgi:hypothetical protein